MSSSSSSSDSDYAVASASGEGSASHVPVTSKRASTQSGIGSSNPSGAQSASDESGKVPKWFKIGE